LASVVAKKLLQGYKIVVVRCDELSKSGHIYRSQRKAMQFRNLRTATNPKWGPFHHRAPSRVFHRVVRGMLPHKTARGAAAYHNLKVFDGCPAPYDTQKKVVVPQALRVLRLRPDSKYASLGDIQKRVGWKYGDVINRMEDVRKAKAFKWHLANKVEIAAKAKATRAANNDASVKPYSALLTAHGF
jgi:large subunit ribosomal protein L13Ae